MGLRVGLQLRGSKNLFRFWNCNVGLLVCNLVLLLSVSPIKLMLEILRTVTFVCVTLKTCLSKNVTLSYYSIKNVHMATTKMMSVSMNINLLAPELFF